MDWTKDNPHISADVKRKNPELFGTTHEAKKKAYESDSIRESDIQGAMESWLEQRGYGRRTPKKLQRHTSAKWFVHLAKPKGNVVIADLLLVWHLPDQLDGENECLELELKTMTGQISPDQRSLQLRGNVVIARGLEAAKNAVKLWEIAVAKRHKK
jgi:hypothetical protein